ncbi:MAG: hypothetical protein H0T42_07785 [Deltaproteobacteria bacterium]|nr:hypothetical protein [Deltaproteobacteria bacterium]
MRLLSKLIAISVLSLAACGGGSDDSPPGPLGKHFDDMFIADVGMDQKQQVIQTQQDWSVAKMENAKAEADLNEANAQLTAVKNDQKGTQLAIDTAISNKKQAESSADNNRINQAAKELHTAESLKKAADLRVKYYEAYRNWLKRHSRYTAEVMYWREAQFELAKSQVAQKANKSPKGVDYNWFPGQEQSRSKRVAGAKGKADSERQKAVAARDAWFKQQESADKESGRPSGLPDPMAPKSESASSAAPSE